MMVSYAGEEVVAGIGLDTMIYTVFIYLFTSISAGGAIVVSQYLGNKKKRKYRSRRIPDLPSGRLYVTYLYGTDAAVRSGTFIGDVSRNGA